MAYVPAWERLSDAFQRVAATGINEEHAREDICKAIADRRIKIRGLVGKETVSSTPVMGTPRWHSAKAFAGGHVAGTVRNGSEVEIPWNLQPLDLNWQQSRPLKPWPDIRRDSVWCWQFDWIELFRDDVTTVLCAGGGSAKARHSKSKRGRPAEYNWDGVKARLTAYVAKHGPVQTMGELLQKCEDFASELHPKKKEPKDKTIRDAIEKHGLDIAASFAPGK